MSIAWRHTMSRTGAVATVHLGGEITYRTKEAIRDLLGTTLRTPGVHTVAADLTDVAFLDSSGLAALLMTSEAADAAGVAFRVVNAERRIRRMFHYTGVLERLTGDTAAGPDPQPAADV